MADDETLLTPTFLLASASHFLHGLSFHLHLHLPGFLTELGADEGRIGLIFGGAAAVAIMVRPFLGRAMDERGRRLVFVSGGIVSAIMTWTYLALASTGVWALLIRTLHGLGVAMLFASLFAFASDIVPPSKRIQGLGLFGVSGMLPMAIGGGLGDWLITLGQGSYAYLFTTSAVCAALALLLSLLLRDKPRPAGGEPPRGVIPALVQINLRPLWFIGVCVATALMAHFAFLKTYVLKTGLGSVGLFFGVYSAAAIALRIFFGSLPERLGPKRVLVPANIATAAGFAMLAGAQADWHVAVAGVLCGIGHGYSFPILLGLVVERARSSERGAALAIFTALFDTGALIGSPLLGFIAEHASYGAMFVTAAAGVTVGTGAFLAWDARVQPA